MIDYTTIINNMNQKIQRQQKALDLTRAQRDGFIKLQASDDEKQAAAEAAHLGPDLGGTPRRK